MPEIKKTEKERKEIDDVINGPSPEEPEESEEEEEVPDPEPDTTEESEEEEEEIEEDPQVAEINRLKKMVADLSAQVGTDLDLTGFPEGGEQPEKKIEKKTEDIQKENKKEEIKGQAREVGFDLTDEQFDSFLNKFEQRVSQRARQETLRDIPDVVGQTVKRQTKLSKAISDFYSKNPDLANYKEYVGFVFNKLQSDNQDIGVESLLNKTEEQVRKNLSLSKKAVDTEQERLKNQTKKKQVNTEKPGTKRRNAGGDQRSELQREIDDILI